MCKSDYYDFLKYSVKGSLAITITAELTNGDNTMIVNNNLR